MGLSTPDLADVDVVLVGMTTPAHNGGFDAMTGQYVPVSLAIRPRNPYFSAFTLARLVSRCPSHLQLTLVGSTIGQIHIHQGLVRNSGFVGQILKIADGIVINSYGNLAFLPSGYIRIFATVRKIVFITHYIIHDIFLSS